MADIADKSDRAIAEVRAARGSGKTATNQVLRDAGHNSRPRERPEPPPYHIDMAPVLASIPPIGTYSYDDPDGEDVQRADKLTTPASPGYYWAKIYGKWQPVAVGWIGEIAALAWTGECDAVTEWGPRIRAPDHLHADPPPQAPGSELRAGRGSGKTATNDSAKVPQ